jgi:zinc protease
MKVRAWQTRYAAWGAAALAVIACAQTIDRTRPPEAPGMRPYQPPPAYETQLPNGLDVLLIDDARAPLATARLIFACGNRRDPKEIPGLAAAVADTLTRGTKRRGFVQIAEDVDGLGGSIGAVSGADHISIGGSIEVTNLRSLVEIMADVARNAEFPEIDLSLYKQNRGQALARQRSQPSFAANEVFRAALFGDHPYAHLGPTSVSLGKMDRDALMAFRDTWLTPNNAHFILIGKLPARADTMKLVADYFGSWERKAMPAIAAAAAPAPSKKLILVDRPGATQADVRMGKIAATQRDPQYFAEIAAALVAGAVPMGRMFQDLRENRGFVYDVRTEHVAFDEAGILSTITQVRNDVAGDAIQAILAHLDRMADEPVTARELADAKSFVTGNFLLRLEPQTGLADELMIERIQNLPGGYLASWTSRVQAVRPEEVQAAAKKYMSTRDMVVVVAGDAAKIGPSLAKIGKFEVVKEGQ